MRFSVLGLLVFAIGCGNGRTPASHAMHAPVTPPPARASASASASSAPAKTPVEEPVAEELTIVSRSVLGFRAQYMPSGDIVVFDQNNKQVFSLGQVRRATFDPTGKLIYAWTEKTGILYEVSTGKKISECPLKDIEGAGFSANGQRIIEVGQGIRFLSVPDLQPTFAIEGGHSELHQTAHRAFTIKDVGGPKSPLGYELKLMLIDIDKEKVIGSLPMNEAMMRTPNIAFSADGTKMSMSLAGTRVWDTTTNKVIELEGGEMPEHPRYEPGPAYFAPDGNSECVEQMGTIRAISIFNVPKGTKRHCFIVGRAGKQWSSEISQGDFEAKIVDIPFTRGTVHPGGSHGLYYRVSMEALSNTENLVAVIEESEKATNHATDAWLLIADANTGQLKHRLALPPISEDTHRFTVQFQDSDKVVIAYDGDAEKGVAFDVGTGASIPMPANFVPPEY